jgi:hypothetical protein
MELKELENWLWDIASILRGPIEAHNYKDYILPLVFLKQAISLIMWAISLNIGTQAPQECSTLSLGKILGIMSFVQCSSMFKSE